MTQSVPATERNESRQSTIVAAQTHSSIGNWAATTTSLVAAMTPTLPVASWNFTWSESWLARNSFTAATTRSIVSALWSAVKIITGMTLQSPLSRPVEVSM